MYLRHMKPDGVIAYHVTNRYLDLVPVVEALAHELRPARVVDPDDAGDDTDLATRTIGCCSREIRQVLADAASSPTYATPIEPRPRLAAVDRRFQQPGAGPEVAMTAPRRSRSLRAGTSQ